MRKIITALFVLLMLCPLGVYAEEDDAALIDEYVSFYSGQIERGIGGAQSEIEEIVPNFSVSGILGSSAEGKLDFSPVGILNYLLKLLLGEVYSTLKIMGVALAISVLCAYLGNLSGAFGKDGISDAAYFICYIIVAGICSAAFLEIVTVAKTAVENMAVFMQTMVPLAIAMLISSGLIVSAEAFEPILLIVVEAAVTVIKTVFIPLLVSAAAVNIANNISKKFNADKLVLLINNLVKWGLGILLTVFTGVAGLQSMAASAVDGMSVKLTKYAASNLIPLVGGILSESVETVMNCSVIIKNSVGVVGIVTLALIAAGPLVKIAASLLVFRITAAVTQPISDERLVKCMTGLANIISMMFAIVASVSVMFIIFLTIVINAGNTAIMLGR